MKWLSIPTNDYIHVILKCVIFNVYDKLALFINYDTQSQINATIAYIFCIVVLNCVNKLIA